MIEALFPTAQEFAAWLDQQGPANQVADTDTFERGGHVVTVNRGAGGRFGRGSRLGDVMHAVADVDDDDEADSIEFDSGRFDWGTRLHDGAYQLDIEDLAPSGDSEDEDEDEDEDEGLDDYRGFARLRLSPSDMKRFAAGLSAALLVHQMQSNPMGDDPNRPLIASLVANTPMNLHFENEWADQSIDWGMLNQDGSVRLLAIDDDGDESSVRLTLPELRRLHAQLVRQNMEEDDNPFLKRPQTAATEMIERDGHMIAVNRGAKGRFSKISAVAQALQDSGNAADSLAGFDRPALMREAKRRELAVPRGATADAVRALILDSTRSADPPPAAPADLQRAALTKLNVPALKLRAAADGHAFTAKIRKPDLIDMIMSGPRNPDAPTERVIADRATSQKGRMSAGELPAANAEIDAMVADPQPWARDRMNNILKRMTLAQMQDVAARHNSRLDTTVPTKDRKAQRLTEHLVGSKLDSRSIERVIMGDGDRNRAERGAVDRQAAIDKVAPQAEFLADLEEAIGNGTDIAALRRMTNQSLRIRGVAGNPHAEGLAGVVATSIDMGEIRRAANASAAAQGLRRIDAGEPSFDPAQHVAIGKIRPGDPVELVRPGYAAKINGEEVTLTKPTVIADSTPDPDVQDARQRLQAAQRAEEAQPDPDSPAANRARQQQNQARAELSRLSAPEREPERDKAVRRRAGRRPTAGTESPLRGLSGSELTAALDNVTADDEETVRAGLDGRSLPELVQIARDVPTVGMPPRQNRTALVDAIVRGTVGFRANARAMRSPEQQDVNLFTGETERPTANALSAALSDGITAQLRREALDQRIKDAADRYQRAGDEVSRRMAERVRGQNKRGLLTPEDIDELLANIEADRVPPAPARPAGRALIQPANAHTLKRGDQFLSGGGETLTVVLHRQGMNAEGQPVVILEARDPDGNTREITLGPNQPVDRLTGISGGGGGTFALTEVHEEFCLHSPRGVHPGPCKGWKDALPDSDPRKKGHAKAKLSAPRRRPAVNGAAGGKMTAADIAALPDDDLFNLFAQLSKKDDLDEPLMRRLIDDMDRRERQTPVPALEDADLTPEQKRVDELVAGGRDYLSAYTEVHGGSETGAGAAAVDRQPGERLDKAVRRSYDEFTHLKYLAAEKATRGHMLNKAGQAAGIDPLTLFTGPVSRARRYASEDLARWWARNERMTLAQFRAQVLGGAKDKAAAAKTQRQSNARDFI